MQVFDGSAVRAQQVQSGFGTTVILTTNGKVYTVGNNSNGQLGDGTTTNSSTPKANRYTNVLPLTIF
ncbi:Regulator of chromosome condensation (RCC1) repeat protein [compost metagenome]